MLQTREMKQKLQERNFLKRKKIGKYVKAVGDWVEKKERLCFHILDFCYWALVCYMFWDMRLVFPYVLSLAMLLVKPKATLIFTLLARYIIFTLFFGNEKCHVYLLWLIIYVEGILSRERVGISLFVCSSLILLVIFYIHENYTWKSPTDLGIRINFNILTRLYVNFYLSFRTLVFIFSRGRAEDALCVEVFELEEQSKDELKFISRLSQYSLTNLHGTVNGLYFLEIHLDRYFEMFPEYSDIREAVMSDLETCDVLCADIQSQTSDIVQYYLIRSHAFRNLTVQMVPVDVVHVVEFAVKIQEKLNITNDEWKRSKINMYVEIENKSSFPKLLSDRKYLSKVVTNLVSNAIKYTDTGVIIVRMKYSVEEKKLVIEVSDTGCGIAKERMSRLFEPYVKSSDTKNESFSIGLIIVKSIVEDIFKGSLKIESRGRGHGTTASFSIPCKRSKNKKFQSQKQKIEIPSHFHNNKNNKNIERSSTPTPTIRYSKEKNNGDENETISDIVVLEDQPVNRKILCHQLTTIFGKDSDVNIHVCENGEQGLSILDNRIKDNNLRRTVVFTDIDMPVMGGTEFVEIVRKRPYGSVVVVYACTGTVIGSVNDFCVTHGFDRVVKKPITIFNTFELLKIVPSVRYLRSQSQSAHAIRRMNVSKRMEQIREDLEKKVEKKNRKEKDKDSDKHKSQMEIYGERMERMEYVSKMSDYALSIGTAFTVLLIRLFCLEEYLAGWDAYCFVLFISIFLQYSTAYFFGFSTETCNVLSIYRMYLTGFVGSSYSIFMKIRVAYCAQFAFVVQAAQSIESMQNLLILTLLFLCKWFFWELYRDMSFVAEDIHFFNVADQICAYYVAIATFVNVYMIRSNSTSRQQHIRNIHAEKEARDNEYQHTYDKISHDLITPSNALVLTVDEMHLKLTNLLNDKTPPKNATSSTDILKKAELIKDLRNMMRIISRSVKNLETSTFNFLTCCKLRKDMLKKNVVHNTVCMKYFLQDLFRYCAVLKEETTIEVGVYCDENISDNMLFTFDYRNARIILVNILMNTFMHSGATMIELIADFEEDSDLIHVQVRDNGIGIDQKILDSINPSQKFRFRERFSNTLGLGLIVVKYLCSFIGGKVSFENVHVDHNALSQDRVIPRPGTMVNVWFKATGQIKKKKKVSSGSFQEEEGGMKKKVENVGKSQSVKSESDQKNSTKKKKENVKRRRRRRVDRKMLYDMPLKDVKVLCVDDNKTIAMYMKGLMIKFGFQSENIVTAMCKAQLWEILIIEKQEFHLMVSDFNLDYGTLFDILRSVRQQRGRRPHVILCATCDERPARDKSGIVDLTTPKPMVPLAILEQLQEYFGKLRGVKFNTLRY